MLLLLLPLIVALATRRPRAVAEALRANLRRLTQRAAAALRPAAKLPPADWVAGHLHLDPQVEATSGRYDLARRPWWRGVLDLLADPEVRSVAIAASTQLGKTLADIAGIIWCAEHAPAPGMVILPDRDTAIEIRDRVYANVLATLAAGVPLRRVRVPPPHQWNTRYIDLGSMRIYLAWAGSRQRLRGRPCRYVWLIECDVYKGDKKAGDPIAAGHQRTKAFLRGLHWHESSPSGQPSEITELEQAASARYRWHCRCPHCGRWQELRFFVHTRGELAGKGGIGGLKNDAGDFLRPEAGRAAAHYLCEAGCRIDNEHKQALLESGQWVPLGCHVGAEGQLVGAGPKSRRTVGLHLWAVHSDATSFGDLAAAYLEAREAGKLADFFGNWLGLHWQINSRSPSWSQLGQRAAWTNPRGVVPREAWFLTMGVDVQGENNGVRYVVRGWGPQRSSWLVDWGWLSRTEGDEAALVKSDLDQLSDVLDCRFPVAGGAANPLGKTALGVRLANVDSNHLPLKVHHWLQSLPESWVHGESPRVRAIRGDHQVKPELRWRRNVVETNTRTGERYDGGLVQWGLYVYPFYDELLQLLAAEPGRPGSWHVTADCLTLGRNYLEQIVNFAPRQVVDEKTGAKKTVWGPRNGRTPIDFWDCEIYALVAAHMVVGDLGWSPEAWEAWRDRARPRGTAKVRPPRHVDLADFLNER